MAVLNDTFLGVYLVVVVTACCICLGARLLGWLAGGRDAVESLCPAVAFASAFLIGHGFLANLWLLIGLPNRWFRPPVVTAIIALALLLNLRPGIRLTWRLARSLGRSAQGLWGEGWAWRGIGGLIVALVFLQGYMAVVQPMDAQGDAVHYYMALPKLVSAHEQLVPMPLEEEFSMQGLSGELQFAALMSMGAGMTTKAFTWPVGLIGLLMVVSIGRVVGLGRRGLWIAVLMTACSPAFSNYIGDGKIDLFGGALGLACYYWVIQTAGEQQRLALRMTGLLLGLTVIARLSLVVPMVPGICLLIVWRAMAGDETRRPWQAASSGFVNLAAIMPWLILSIVPHFLKNEVHFGSGFLPFTKLESWGEHHWFSPEDSRFLILTYPIQLVFGNHPMQGGNMSPLLIAFGPLILLVSRPKDLFRSPLFQLSVAGVVGVVIWIIVKPGVFAPRFLLPTLILLLLLGARGAEHILQMAPPPRKLVFLIYCFLIATIGFEFQHYFYGRISPYDPPIVPTPLTAGRVIYPEGPSVDSIKIINSQARPGDRIFLATSYRYYLKPDLLQLIVTGQESRRTLESDNSDSAWLYLIDRGFRYVVLDRHLRSYFEALGISESDGKLTIVPPPGLHVTKLYNKGRIVLLRIEVLHGHKPSITTRRVGLTRWEIEDAK